MIAPVQIIIQILLVFCSPACSFLLPAANHQHHHHPPQTRSGTQTSIHNSFHNAKSHHYSMCRGGDSGDITTRLCAGNDAASIEPEKQSSSNLAVIVSLFATVSSWCFISWKGLMYHPTLQLCLRHNLFTIAHALIFPLPVMIASFLALIKNPGDDDDDNNPPLIVDRIQRRILLGIVVMSLWTSAAIFWIPKFSVGYDLFTKPIRYSCSSVYLAVAIWAASKWKRNVSYQDGDDNNSLVDRIVSGCVKSFYSLLSPNNTSSTNNDDDSMLYAASSLGLFLLALLPQLVSFPSATVPTLLGKRLSRPASGFTFLGAILAHCLQDAASEGVAVQEKKSKMITTIRRGLAVGGIGHIGLVIAKVIGLDGGGLLLPGNGLWEFYPSLVKASGAMTFLMFVTYSLLGYATCTKTSPNE